MWGIKVERGALRGLDGGFDKSSVRCAKRCMMTLLKGCVGCIGICSFSNVINTLGIEMIDPSSTLNLHSYKTRHKTNVLMQVLTERAVKTNLK
jgi:hypothetical protein